MSVVPRVCLDLTPLQPMRSGVDRYLITLAGALVDPEAHPFDLTILVNRADKGELERITGGRATVVTVSLGGRLGRVLAAGAVIPWLTARRRFDVVHWPSFLMPAIRGPARHVVTVHDMTMHSRPELHARVRRNPAFRAAVFSSVRRADLVLVPSEHVRADLLRLLPDVDGEMVRSVPLGLAPCFSPPDSPPPPEDDPFVLFVGTLEPRKNVETLLDAYRRAVENHDLRHRLVIAGGLGWGAGEALEMSRRPPLRDRVRLAGHVPEDELVALYRGASFFVFPSLEEGFGYPPLEAMACGTPVVAGDTSSLRENLEGAARLVRPDDPEALAAAMARLASDNEERRRLRIAGLERARCFSALEMARRTIGCYRELSACDRDCRPAL